ncbi:MAG: DUF6883 domain-containing protein [Rubrobacter sp.]
MGASIPETPSAAWFAGGIVERRKLEEYLLSPTHPDGKNKLRLWRGVFGIEEGDVELLERLLRQQLSQAEPQERGTLTTRDEPPKTIHRWEIVIPRFQGPNGNVVPVLTAWALVPDRDLPHLTTAWPLVGRSSDRPSTQALE